MINIENVDVHGYVPAIRGMRNSFASWDKSDSFSTIDIERGEITRIGKKDLALIKKLTKAGSDERKFLRMITVWVDITAPLYWWKQMDTYKVGTVSCSTSTMHNVADKEFTIDDFSTEHLIKGMKEVLDVTIFYLNACRGNFIESKDKEWWWQIIQLLPSTYNQKRTVMLNYEVLLNIYNSRKHHKLDEWKEFCDWILTLPIMKDLLEVE